MRSIAQYNLCKLKRIRTISKSIYFTRSIPVWGYRSGMLERDGVGWAVWREEDGMQPKQREVGPGCHRDHGSEKKGEGEEVLDLTNSTVSKR